LKSFDRLAASKGIKDGEYRFSVYPIQGIGSRQEFRKSIFFV